MEKIRRDWNRQNLVVLKYGKNKIDFLMFNNSNKCKLSFTAKYHFKSTNLLLKIRFLQLTMIMSYLEMHNKSYLSRFSSNKNRKKRRKKNKHKLTTTIINLLKWFHKEIKKNRFNGLKKPRFRNKFKKSKNFLSNKIKFKLWIEKLKELALNAHKTKPIGWFKFKSTKKMIWNQFNNTLNKANKRK